MGVFYNGRSDPTGGGGRPRGPLVDTTAGGPTGYRVCNGRCRTYGFPSPTQKQPTHPSQTIRDCVVPGRAINESPPPSQTRRSGLVTSVGVGASEVVALGVLGKE